MAKDRKNEEYDATDFDEKIQNSDEFSENQSGVNMAEHIEADHTSVPIEEKQSSAQKVMDALTDDDEEHVNLSFGAVLGGDILSGKWFRREVWFLVMIIFMIILYITNRYTSQQNMIKIDNLKKELTEIRYESMTRSSQLMQRTRESKVEEFLKNTSDSALCISANPPYVIKLE
ncbi:MAG: FtsL-like putative cell division protein [Bacteroidaceae bacterium]|jgi:hypothetical protein|nr:FtsL-like putative cell division protein [Bacteroidaceae bacterium]